MSPIYWVLGVLVIAIIGLATWMSYGRLGAMPPLVDDRPGPDLPDGPLRGQDLRGLQLAVVTRGYSMPQVEALLDRLANQLDAASVPEVDAEAVPVAEITPDAPSEPIDSPVTGDAVTPDAE